ncbi:MFS transporter [Streptomyces alfalfae]|uniref:MFS transporter n=1 Tax=Streptomyces alfalfae TaxID=1642299 RepID=A0A7T4PBU9_9ACTN|nr:MFS transporter [Streptomyces alfalfae]QQC87361.1 MFS transporter [Streptomyces alfalfae]
MNSLRTLRQLPPRARRLIVLNAVNAAGSGVVLPLLVIYLHEMRGLSLTAATGAVAATSVGALVGGPLAGWVSDRLGRVPAVWAALVCAALGAVGYALCDTPTTALAAGFVQGLGVGGAITWNALMADLVPEEHWPVLFSADFAMVNAMMGIGGLLGGLLAGMTDSLAVFQALFLLDAASFLVTGWLVAREVRRRRSVEPPTGETPPEAAAADQPRSGYRAVLGHRWLVALLVVVLVLFTVGYSQLNSGMPAALLADSRLGPTELGVLFAANTAAVVLVQAALIGRIKQVTAGVALALLAASWAAFWLLIWAVTGLSGGLVALLVGVIAMVVFAVGESLLAATGPTLVNSWADDSNRGRFNAAYGFVCSLGFTVGPLVSGRLTDDGHTTSMMLGFTAVLAVLALITVRSRFLPRTPLSGLERTGHEDAAEEDARA